MAYLGAFFVFFLLAAASWIVASALYRSTFDCPSPLSAPGAHETIALAVGLVAVTSFVSFPTNLGIALLIWAVTVYRYLELPVGRATVLLGYLAEMSVVARLVVVGVMNY